MYPAHLAMPEHSDLDLHSRGESVKVRGGGLRPHRAIFGVKWKLAQEIFAACKPSLGRKPIDLQHSRRGVELVRCNDPVPMTIACGFHCKGVAGLGVT